MASYNFDAENTLQLLAGIPILLLGLYVYKSNAKELSNRVFALLCALWTTFIVAVNLVFMAGDEETANLWNAFYVYALIAFFPVLLHFVLVFPYRSRLLGLRWIVPALYAFFGMGILIAIVRKGLVIVPAFQAPDGTWYPNYRPVLLLAFGWTFTVSVILLLMRYVMMDLDVTRKRLYFVTFALATYALYQAIQDLHTNAETGFQASLVGYDRDVWNLTLAADYLLFVAFFGLLSLLSLRARIPERRRDAVLLLVTGFAAVLTGFFDPIIHDNVSRLYPGTLWLWRLGAVGLMFYAILRYQLFDLHVRVRVGVKYGSLTTLFAAVFFTALGYFSGLIAAAALVFLFTPVQHLIERFSKKVVPPSSTETYERYRSMEIYRAALEGALADSIVSPAELNSLKNLRLKLAITDADHALLERDVRGQMGTRPA
jgi:hypothetical protein